MPSLDDLAGRLELWEARTSNKTKHANDEALVVQFRKLFRNQRFQNNNYKRTNSINSTQKTKQGYCGHCGKWGHWARDYDEQSPVPPATMNKSHQINTIRHHANQDSDEDSSSDHPDNSFQAILKTLISKTEENGDEPAPEDHNQDDAIAMISEIALIVSTPNDTTWILDTGATKHVTGNSKLRNQLQYDNDSVSARTSSGHSYPVGGRGCINMQLGGNKQETITNILYVPGMTRNFLFVGELMDSGMLACFDAKHCLIMTKDPKPIVVASGIRDNNSKLYHLSLTNNLEDKSNNAFLTGQIDQAQLWHMRMGHIGYKTLHQMSHNNFIIGLPQLPLIATICESYQKGRQSRKSFPKKSKSQAKQVLIDTLRSLWADHSNADW